jgi:transposase InsO family protein
MREPRRRRLSSTARSTPASAGPGAAVALVQQAAAARNHELDYAQTVADHGVLASVGSVGDAYDNALAECFVDTFKTERIERSRLAHSFAA